MLAMESLAQVLTDAREDAQVLRRAGNAGQADYVDALLDRLRVAAEDLIVWLSEDEAKLKSGLTTRTLRRRFREWQDCGLARYTVRGHREYVSAIIPPRPDTAAQRARGRQAGTGR